ncbi:MAG: hypothetical protein KGD58_01530 [Candidatus Lokiarchaeota archaeon]|nr:hypothetical protein [Candidatus Lokiarchaeota archaeon]
MRRKNRNKKLSIVDQEKIEIAYNCWLLRSEDNLTVKIDLSWVSRIYRLFSIILILGAILSLFLCIILKEINSGLVAFVILFVCALPFIYRYVYFKIQTHILIFDKSSQMVTFLKVFSNIKKKISNLNFSEIESLICGEDPRDLSIYKLEFVIRDNKVKVYYGEKDLCKKLGNYISNFMQKPLKYK